MISKANTFTKKAAAVPLFFVGTKNKGSDAAVSLEQDRCQVPTAHVCNYDDFNYLF
ncbi:hypothetical protein [Paenibacillus sp. FSL H7-0331]|uniref:hypothetical protein n=1 Tax=Paenibacillus sp. FSL H7-0331 TaxID=1920421 RepID=UPI001C4BA5D5|nr:hypothetical protein [Paenibacillus sp. FSL H7-0331]